MDEQKGKNQKAKKPIRIMRERYGGVSERLKSFTRSQTSMIKKIKEMIGGSYKTVPEIAQLTGIPSRDVLWHLMAMKKYGMVIEGEEQDNYYTYTLKEEEDKK